MRADVFVKAYLMYKKKVVQRKKTPLSTMGVLQYIAPMLQLLLGVMVYGEPFTQTEIVGFAIVWAGLVAFGVDGFLAHRAAVVPAG